MLPPAVNQTASFVSEGTAESTSMPALDSLIPCAMKTSKLCLRAHTTLFTCDRKRKWKLPTFSMSAALAPGFSARTISRASNPYAVNAVQPLVARGAWGDRRWPPVVPRTPWPSCAATSAAAMSRRRLGSLPYCCTCARRGNPN